MPESVRHDEFVRGTWPAHAHGRAAIRSEVHRWLRELPLTEDLEDDVVLAVNEAATNSIEHAYPANTEHNTVELAFWIEAGVVCIAISDHGRWRPVPVRDHGRGRGITLMQRLVESVVIHYGNFGTRVLLRHPLPADVVAQPT